MRALVTGGAGLIGSHVVDQLVNRGWDVRVLDSLDPDTHPNGQPSWLNPEADFLRGDVRDPSAVRRALDGVELVFHQAAYGGFTGQISRYLDTNTTGTALLIETIRENRLPVRKLVLASSQAVYGEGSYFCEEHGIQHPTMRPVEQLRARSWEVRCPTCRRDLAPVGTPEDAPIGTPTPYGWSKYASEQLAIRIGRGCGLPVVALRYSLTYGPRQSLFNPYTGICSLFSTRILNDMPVVVYEDGRQTRDFIFVEDVARANLLVAESDAANYRVFNVGTGVGTSVLRFVSTLGQAYGQDARPLLRGEFRPGDVRHLTANADALRELGFRPQVTLEEGLAHYVKWIRTQKSVEERWSSVEENLRQLGIVAKADYPKAG